MSKKNQQKKPVISTGNIPSEVPADVGKLLEQNWSLFVSAAKEENLQIPEQADFLKILFQVWAGSDFVANNCIAEPELLIELVDSSDLITDYNPEDFIDKIKQQLSKVKNEDELAARLRQIRRREMVRIAWRDLAGWSQLNETMRDLSLLAEVLVDTSLRKLETWVQKEFGIPRSEDGEDQHMVVIAMGKLGAQELNFSSDIDLIFAYPKDGYTSKRKRTSNEEFFIQLGQRLINALNEPTGDGFVYRVDMRLRPYGESGPLVMSFDSLENYYQTQGREWERYAMIKARVIAGDYLAGKQLMEMLRPFIYRRYLDYGVIDSLRELKAMISKQVATREMEDNIKLGPGGIREVEFFGQIHQLIRGGREPALRVRGILSVLQQISDHGHQQDDVINAMQEAYIFLRRVENRLQELDDRQEHALPKGELERERLVYSMGFSDWGSFLEELDRHRNLVQENFERLIEDQQDGTGSDLTARQSEVASIWAELDDKEQVTDILNRNGFKEPVRMWHILDDLKGSYSYRILTPKGQERMDRLIRLLLIAVIETDDPDECLLRIVNLVEAIAGRTAYMLLLVENPAAMIQLIKLFAVSPWIANLLTSYPVLLDELLDARSLYLLTHREALHEELAQSMSIIDTEDLEQQMEALRYFKLSHVLHIAAADITAQMPLMEVSNHLTMVAEETLTETLRFTKDKLELKNGKPRYKKNGKVFEAGFAIIAYGKLGGLELGYGSDLDLVFLHDSEGSKQQTSGPTSINNSMFFNRLGTRMIHIFNTHTPSGILYEIDMRLRQSGASGLLCNSIESFADYQHNEAWTWEHQALVRARPVAGDPRVALKFMHIREEILGMERDPEVLRNEVVEMRERMRTELNTHESGKFSLKQGRGGIADIEFIVQYGVLRWANTWPELIMYADNINILTKFASSGLMDKKDARLLREAYVSYRARLHHLTLREESTLVDEAEFTSQRKNVTRIWENVMG